MTIYSKFVDSIASNINSDDAIINISIRTGKLLEIILNSISLNEPVDYKNIKEELGDLEFHIQRLINIYNCYNNKNLLYKYKKSTIRILIVFSILPTYNILEQVISLSVESSKLLNCNKKLKHSEKNISYTDIHKIFNKMFDNICSIIHILNYHGIYCTERSIKKDNMKKIIKNYNKKNFNEESILRKKYLESK